MITKLEIVKVIKAGTNTQTETDSTTNKDWWKQPFVTIEPETDAETDEMILTVSRSKALIGKINTKTIKQLTFAGYSVLKVDGEFQIYPSLYIPLSRHATWQGIKTILENCGYKVTVIAG